MGVHRAGHRAADGKIGDKEGQKPSQRPAGELFQQRPDALHGVPLHHRSGGGYADVQVHHGQEQSVDEPQQHPRKEHCRHLPD